jgi:hypothetical protein
MLIVKVLIDRLRCLCPQPFRQARLFTQASNRRASLLRKTKNSVVLKSVKKIDTIFRVSKESQRDQYGSQLKIETLKVIKH